MRVFTIFGLHAAFPVLILILGLSAIQREETFREETEVAIKKPVKPRLPTGDGGCTIVGINSKETKKVRFLFSMVLKCKLTGTSS